MGKIDIRDKREQREVDRLWIRAKKLKRKVLTGRIDQSVHVDSESKGKRITITSNNKSICWEDDPRHANRINCRFEIDGGIYSVAQVRENCSLSTVQTPGGYSLNAEEVIQKSNLCLDFFTKLVV